MLVRRARERVRRAVLPDAEVQVAIVGVEHADGDAIPLPRGPR